MAGPVEADETYVGGKERNKHERDHLHAGRGAVGKTAVAGVKDRATGRVSAAVVARTDGPTLKGFVRSRIAQEADVFTDEHASCQGLPNHETVAHSVGEYVNGQAHTNGIESFWSMLKRGYYGTYHRMSPKHLARYVAEFAGQAVAVQRQDHEVGQAVQRARDLARELVLPDRAFAQIAVWRCGVRQIALTRRPRCSADNTGLIRCALLSAPSMSQGGCPRIALASGSAAGSSSHSSSRARTRR